MTYCALHEVVHLIFFFLTCPSCLSAVIIVNEPNVGRKLTFPDGTAEDAEQIKQEFGLFQHFIFVLFIVAYATYVCAFQQVFPQTFLHA